MPQLSAHMSLCKEKDSHQNRIGLGGKFGDARVILALRLAFHLQVKTCQNSVWLFYQNHTCAVHFPAISQATWILLLVKTFKNAIIDRCVLEINRAGIWPELRFSVAMTMNRLWSKISTTKERVGQYALSLHCSGPTLQLCADKAAHNQWHIVQVGDSSSAKGGSYLETGVLNKPS